MKINIDNQKCDQCGTCISVCSANAIELMQEIFIDENICTLCKSCVKICPFGALSCGEK